MPPCYIGGMALSDIVNVSITSATVTPSRPGFGTALIAAYKVPLAFTNRVRKFGSLAEMISFGFLTTDPAYLAATKYFSANPRPQYVKIGRRALAPVQTVTLQCLSAIQGDVYTIDVGKAGFPLTTLTYTVLAAATTTTVATAIELLTEAVTGVDSTQSTDTITVTKASADAAGSLVDFRNWSTNFKMADITADPGIVTDLTAMRLEDSDWYGLVLDSASKNEIIAAAAWVETQRLLFPSRNSDYAITDSVSTTDVAYLLKNSAYGRTGILYSQSQLLSYSDAAWLGNRFGGANPGQDTWKFKTLKGIAADLLTSGQTSAAWAKNANVYTSIASVNVTQNGTTASGEYWDVIRFVDWTKSEIEIRIFAALANLQKIPYTDKGVAVVVGIIKGVLQDGINVGGLSSDPAPVVVAPKVADIDPVTRGTRVLPNVTFQATLAGAIHVVNIQGTVSV